MRPRTFPNLRRIHEFGLESFKEKSSSGNLRGCKQLSFYGNMEHIKIGGPSANGIMPLGFFSRGLSFQIQTEIKRESCMFIGTTLMCRVMSKELGCPQNKHLPKDGHKWKK
jgi:hypothetical protein